MPLLDTNIDYFHIKDLALIPLSNSITNTIPKINATAVFGMDDERELNPFESQTNPNQIQRLLEPTLLRPLSSNSPKVYPEEVMHWFK